MFYEKLSKLSFDEDMLHEFKGHRNFCSEEIPRWSQATKTEKASRKPISRNLCGFLNTGKGGTVYCGVADDGTVHGLKLSQYQKDHVVGVVNDLMSRYTPPVPSYRYKVKFVPIFSESVTKEKREEMLNYKPKDHIDEAERQRKHTFRSAEYCWCDKDAIAKFHNEIVISDYVIEVIILPWDPDNRENQGLGTVFNLHPIHEDEQGHIYFRNQASLCQYTLQQVSDLTRLEVRDRKDQLVKCLEARISQLQKKITQTSVRNGDPTTHAEDCSTTP